MKIEAAARLQHELYAMSGLKSDKTGLPNSIFIWFSTKAGAQHGPRIKVSNTRGKYNSEDLFCVSITADPSVVKDKKGEPKAGKPKCFKSFELQAIYQWVVLNKDILLVFWNSDDMDDDDIKPFLKKLHP